MQQNAELTAMRERRERDRQKRMRRRRVWRGCVSTLACIVVFCVTYALILPAITMEKEAFCGIAEHTHEAQCYGAQSVTVCAPGGEEDLPVLHSHDAFCYQEDALICTLPELAGHVHTDTCYETITLEAHAHDDSCSGQVRGSLLCQLPEEAGHAHEAACYGPGQSLICTDTPREGHSHADTCYTVTRELTCKTAETAGHSHSESCYISASQLACGLAEDGNHTHTDACYVQSRSLGCGQEEAPAHTHADGCYSQVRTLTCQLPEDPGHTHSDACYEQVLICQEPEKEGHAHSDSCYEMVSAIVCGKEARAEAATQTNLVCGLSQLAPHVHNESCTDAAGNLICTIRNAAVHQHTEECIQVSQSEENLICQTEVHSHTLSCFADPAADVETAADWEKTFAHVELTGNWGEDVVAIAKTQLGYNESTKNYIVEEDGETIKGYTRYGAWYGAPYGDWCAMFASFCYRYAGVQGVPTDASCPNWIRTLEHLGLYRTSGAYTPQTGDLIFFDWNANGDADHVGLVAEMDGDSIKTIEGNSGDTVRYQTYELSDTRILGYGALPHQLTEEEQAQVDHVIALIQAIPSAEEIEAKIAEFEEAEDYEGEEAWLTEVYQQIARAYAAYSSLGEELQSHVTNRDKLLELEYIWSAVTLAETQIAKKVDYSADMFKESNRFVVYTSYSSRNNTYYYAFDGTGAAIQITIDDAGNISTTAADIDSLIWEFSDQGNNAYVIKNVSTGLHMHSHSTGVTTEGGWSSSIVEVTGGVRIKSNSDYAKLNSARTAFERTNESGAATFNFGMVVGSYSIHLDGTNGGLMAFTGSPDRVEATGLKKGDTYTLPETWDTPYKYHYSLNGWYDITTGTYYQPGAPLTVQGNHVLYADWMAGTYDVGFFNEHTVDSLDTNKFITTHVFDYSSIFNMYSTKYTGTAGTASHWESWDLVRLTPEEMNSTKYGTTADEEDIPVHGNHSMGFIFRDWDSGGVDLSYPNEANQDWNASSTGSTNVTDGILNSDIGIGVWDKLFFPGDTDGTGQPVLGKKYVGQGNYLYQYTDTGFENGKYAGYYYYDSTRNAASYNQTKQRFYIYDYLERTSDSLKDGCNSDGSLNTAGGHSDFLPFNSPYANTNGMNQVTYQVDENDKINYEYDAKYEGQESEAANIGTNYWFGFSSTIDFYLPNATGYSEQINGQTVYGNQSTKGTDMTFHFSGDDDVWVFVDGKLVLDLGGMHDIVDGDINFSTGVVTNAGDSSTLDLKAGHHELTIYYMERGASQANCMIYFNISPMYNMTIEKEDILSGQLLNGAEFTVYTDAACTKPATLWTSRASYENNEAGSSVFKVVNGEASLYGFVAGNVYYIKETKAPDGGYELPDGIIKLTFNTKGDSSYEVLEMVNDAEGDAPSPGFTAYGFRIDPETEEAYLVITNGKAAEATQVMVQKVWNGGTERPDVTAYLYANGVKIREVTLNDSNDWQYVWKNLPKYMEDGTTPIVYTVTEGTVPGYWGTVKSIETLETTTTAWNSAASFTSGGTYLLRTSSGYLATVSASDASLQWVTEDVAKASPAAQWVVTGNSNGWTLTNKAGQTLYRYYRSRFGVTAYYQAASSNPGNYYSSSLLFQDQNLYRESSYRLATTFYDTGCLSAVSSSSAASFTLYRETTTTTNVDVEGYGFQITNTPVTETTRLTVTKSWTDQDGNPITQDNALYELYNSLTVPVKLMANGSETGQTAELKLSNNWTYTFSNLPAKDASGSKVTYSVVEDLDTEVWTPTVRVTENADGTFTASITNTYSQKIKIPVEKAWDPTVSDSDKTPLTVLLYWAAEDNTEGTKVAEITLNQANGWKGSFTAEALSEGGYYVLEQTKSFLVKYSEPAVILIDGKPQNVGKVTYDTTTGQSVPLAVTVTNYKMHALPETGGTGTILYTTGGLLLMTVAVLLLLHKNKRRKEERPSF